MVGFSAFAIKSNHCGSYKKPVAKIAKKKTHKSSTFSLFDLVMLPSLNG
jgi:hypothetical protein